MTHLSEKLIATSRKAEARLATRQTPFIYACWYVAGFSWEFDRKLRARTLLSRPLVLFRSEAGHRVALSDRCIHRSFPLSKSELDGDSIICGYHGLRYDIQGDCIEVPSLRQACPNGIGVRSYRYGRYRSDWGYARRR